MPPKVRDAIRVVERDGWYLMRTRGSHRHFRHPEKPGTVTIPGPLGSDLKPGTWRSIMRQAGLGRGNRSS
ncbi:MAG: type II toxin-antitoxin system HicA family toxin [Chloroflexi bacterium]|nr:type II toxin-antitoxin system HicA family toxin [Chloroflexota bacterium]